MFEQICLVEYKGHILALNQIECVECIGDKDSKIFFKSGIALLIVGVKPIDMMREIATSINQGFLGFIQKKEGRHN
jgi:hypothetical protein